MTQMHEVPALYNLSICNSDGNEFQYLILEMINRIEELEKRKHFHPTQIEVDE